MIGGRGEDINRKLIKIWSRRNRRVRRYESKVMESRGDEEKWVNNDTEGCKVTGRR